MALSKVANTAFYAITSVASNTVSVGSAVNVSTYYAVQVRIRVGRATGTAFTTAPEIRIEGTAASSPTNDDWVVITSFTPAVGASIASQTLTVAGTSGATALTVALGTNFAANDFIFVHNTTLAQSEWRHLTSVNTSTLNMWDGLVNAQSSGGVVRDQAEEYTALIDCTNLQQLRLVVNAYGTGQAVVVMADYGAVSGL